MLASWRSRRAGRLLCEHRAFAGFGVHLHKLMLAAGQIVAIPELRIALDPMRFEAEFVNARRGAGRAALGERHHWQAHASQKTEVTRIRKDRRVIIRS